MRQNANALYKLRVAENGRALVTAIVNKQGTGEEQNALDTKLQTTFDIGLQLKANYNS